jgi:hypothetical protein
VPIRRFRHWLCLALLTSIVSVCNGRAQTCGDNLDGLKIELAATGDFKVVLRAVAVGGKPLIPGS